MSAITLRFLVEPGAVGPGGHVHSGTVMKWIDEAGYASATTWARGPCRAVYMSSIRFLRVVRSRWSTVKKLSSSWFRTR